MSEDRIHHPYSPSSLQSTEACPCYKNRDSKHIRGIMGTIAHKVTETREDDQRLSDDDAAAAAECIDFYDRRRLLAFAARESAIREADVLGVPDAEKQLPHIIELQETYLSVDEIEFPDGVISTTAGFVDRVLIMHDGTYAELFDWKFGLWPVEKAENNLQGIAYTLGLFRKYPHLKSARFWFKQPYTGVIDYSLFTREMIPALYLRLQVVVARARQARALVAQGDFSMANPMVPVCNFCDNIGRCSKVLDIALKVGKKFYPLEIPENITPTMVQDPHNTSMAMRLTAVLAVFAKAFRTLTTDRVVRREADPPDGFVLTGGTTPRQVKDAAKLKEVSLQYLTPEEYQKLLPQEPPFGELESAISDKAPRGHKKSTVEEFQAKILEAGAVEKGTAYAFLKAVAKKEN